MPTGPIRGNGTALFRLAEASRKPATIQAGDTPAPSESYRVLHSVFEPQTQTNSGASPGKTMKGQT
jgi:hypothetical protein